MKKVNQQNQHNPASRAQRTLGIAPKPAHHLAQLQRSVGNRAVRSLLAQPRPPAASTAIQRLTISEITSIIDVVLDEDDELLAAVAKAISLATEEWQRATGGIYFDRARELTAALDKYVFEMQLEQRKTPTDAEGWLKLIRPHFVDELASERKFHEQERRRALAAAEASSSDEVPYEPTFEDKLSETIAELARPLDMPLASTLTLSREEQRRIERNQQKTLMLASALSQAQSIDPRLTKLVQDPKFIGAVLVQIKATDPITFNDVLNMVALELPKQGQKDSAVQSVVLQERIDVITTASLSAAEKIASVAELLWGSFDWYVNSDDVRERHADQRDQFILWLTDTSRKTPEPSGAAQMNCWEGAIFVLFKAGFVAESTLRNLYREHSKDTAGVGVAYKVLAADDRVVMYHDEEYIKDTHPARGDIVSLWQSSPTDPEPHHVALAMGPDGRGKDTVLSLWSGKTGGMFGKTTVQDLLNSRGTSHITYNTPKLTL